MNNENEDVRIESVGRQSMWTWDSLTFTIDLSDDRDIMEEGERRTARSRFASDKGASIVNNEDVRIAILREMVEKPDAGIAHEYDDWADEPNFETCVYCNVQYNPDWMVEIIFIHAPDCPIARARVALGMEAVQ